MTSEKLGKLSVFLVKVQKANGFYEQLAESGLSSFDWGNLLDKLEDWHDSLQRNEQKLKRLTIEKEVE